MEYVMGEAEPRHGANYTSFVFTVEELPIRPSTLRTDSYGRRMLPEKTDAYRHRIPSKLMLWCDGSVEEVPWNHVNRSSSSSSRHHPGYLDDDSNYHCLERYKTGAVFVCPSAEIMATQGDPMFDPAEFHFVQINHPYRTQTELRGVSQLVTVTSERPTGGEGREYAAGTNPTWIPAILPDCYNIDGNPPGTIPSRGLGGELPIVIGLMAFHGKRGKAANANKVNQIFLGKAGKHQGLWQNYQWHSHTRPRGYPVRRDRSPRGFVVSIYFDPCNPQGSNYEALLNLEWQQILVNDN